jgi:hypothetical protein
MEKDIKAEKQNADETTVQSSAQTSFQTRTTRATSESIPTSSKNRTRLRVTMSLADMTNSHPGDIISFGNATYFTV